MSDGQASKSTAKANILGRVYLCNLKRSLWNKSVFIFLVVLFVWVIKIQGVLKLPKYPFHRKMVKDFPGSPVVKTPSFPLQGHGFNLWSGS